MYPYSHLLFFKNELNAMSWQGNCVLLHLSLLLNKTDLWIASLSIHTLESPERAYRNSWKSSRLQYNF